MAKKKITKKKSVTPVKRGRGRPLGSKNKKKPMSLKDVVPVAESLKLVEESASNIRHLDIDHLSGIIKLCNQFKLKSFQYDKLSLVFKNDSDLPIIKQRTPKHVKGIETVGDLQETSESVDDRIEYLKITDPQAYEEFMQSEEATDGQEQ